MSSEEKTNTPKTLTLAEQLEPLIIDMMAIVSLLLPFHLNVPVDAHAPIFILVIFYGLHNTHPPRNNFFLEATYGILLIGGMFGVAGVGFLLGDLLGALVGLMIAFPIFLIKGDGGKANPFTAFYEHPIRILLLPVLFTLFMHISADILTLRAEPPLAMILFFMMFLPVRVLVDFERPKRFYHILALLGALAFYTYEMYHTINNSPTSPVWQLVSGQESQEDYMKVIEQKDSTALVEAHFGGHYTRKLVDGGSYQVYTSKDSVGQWQIDIEATKQLYANKGNSAAINDSTAIVRRYNYLIKE